MKIRLLAIGFVTVLAGCSSAPLQVQLPDDPSTSDIDEYVVYLENEKEEFEHYLQQTVEEPESLEGVPPYFNFYYSFDQGLNIVTISVGHETWAKEFVYYFYKNKLIKYEDWTHGRDDHAPTLVNYYDGVRDIQVEVAPVLEEGVIMLEFLNRDGFTDEEIEAMSNQY